jgi:hypothetical protein
MDRAIKERAEKFPNGERALAAIAKRYVELGRRLGYEDPRVLELEGNSDCILDLQNQGSDITPDLADFVINRMEGE